MEVREITVGIGRVHRIDEFGNIYKLKGNETLKISVDKSGYYRWSFLHYKTRKAFNYLVHRLVYEAFVGPIPEGMTIDHIDGNKLNNHYSNLQLLSREENTIKGNAKVWKFVSPEGVLTEVYNLSEFCRENGLHEGHMRYVHYEKPHHHQHKGWRKGYD